MSRKSKDSLGEQAAKAAGRALKNAARSAVKKEIRKAVGKTSKRSGRKIPVLPFVISLLLLFAAALGITFIPEDKVPAPLAPVHTTLLSRRNYLVRQSRLPISCYDDVHSLMNPGSDPIHIYFAPSPKISSALCAFLRSAVRSIDVCAFDIGLEAVADTLIEAKKKNIKVRVVTDTDYLKRNALGRISKAGISIVSDRKKSLMHNKFIVVDSRYVWTGSYNLTDNGTWKNDNNAIVFESPAVAAGYQARFDQYWSEHFSNDGRRTELPQQVFIGKMPVYYAFSPTDKIRDVLLDELGQAKSTVDVMAFSFTGAELAAKLRDLCKRGVKVRCLFDRGQAKNKASRDEYLHKIGAQVYISPNRRGKMHHKVFIIDGKTVVTGSYNFSRNAESQNDENILILRSEPIAKLYTAEMNRCIKGIKGY